MRGSLPGSQLGNLQPFADDAGHLDEVGQVMQQDQVVLAEGQRVKSSLQTAQPVNGRGPALQLFNAHALIEQSFGRAVAARRGGHGQL